MWSVRPGPVSRDRLVLISGKEMRTHSGSHIRRSYRTRPARRIPQVRIEPWMQDRRTGSWHVPIQGQTYLGPSISPFVTQGEDSSVRLHRFRRSTMSARMRGTTLVLRVTGFYAILCIDSSVRAQIGSGGIGNLDVRGCPIIESVNSDARRHNDA